MKAEEFYEDINKAQTYKNTRRVHWNKIALKYSKYSPLGSQYRKFLYKIYQFLVLPNQRVLELGCGKGDLLAAVKPKYGVGLDFSEEMIKAAKLKHPHLEFVLADAHDFITNEPFDVILISDLVDDLFDVQMVFERIQKYSNSETLIILNTYSRVWEYPLKIARRLGLATAQLPQNWLTVEDISNILSLTGFVAIRHWQDIIFPIQVPLLSNIINRFISKIWPFNHFCLTNFMVIRGQPTIDNEKPKPLVSVVIPARNEEGHIEEIVVRTPELGRGTEFIFVEGHSQDKTYQTIEKVIAKYPQKRFKLFQQSGEGKGDAVRLGFENATGEILMILDADMTVPPETLPKFYNAIVKRKGSFINGVRLVYPMEKEAMRFFNLLGNKFFSLTFSWLLGQPIKDTLCGTKVLWKKDYKNIALNRDYFGDFDPFGDFDLLFGAARMNLKIIEIPIRYREREYGTTNIQRWRHGLMLIRMAIFASSKIKFI